MKYFIDTEFLEGPQKEKFPISLFRKNTPNTIDLISIGIVAEDKREYYAISKDFNLKEAWNRFDWKHEIGAEPKKVYWIRENVLKPIWREMFLWQECDTCYLSNQQSELFNITLQNGNHDSYFTFKSFKALLEICGKTNKEIAKEIKDFCKPIDYWHSITLGPNGIFPNNIVSISNEKYYNNSMAWKHIKETCDSNHPEFKNDVIRKQDETREFYAYYADYDWVVFCWLFGKMIDLPNGFPMYCKDLKQILDEKINNLKLISVDGKRTLRTFDEKLEKIKYRTDYPKQENGHNALADAIWNKKLYEFLNKL